MQKLFLFTIAIAIGLVACDKKSDLVGDTDSSVRSKAPVSNNIRYFENYEQLSEEIDRTISMSLEQLCAYEAELDFNSFGKLADLAYEEVAKYEDDYKNIAEVKAAIANFPEYLQLIEDEEMGTSVETKLYQRITKYVINEEKMYQVNDSLIKILENGLIQTSVNKYKELLSINEENVLEFLEDENFKILLDNFYGSSGDNWGLEGNPHNYPLANHLGKYKMNENVKTIKVDGRNRDHRLRVKVRIDFISYTKEKLSYEFESRRKGIWNGAWWGFGQPVKFDLNVTIAQGSAGQQVHDMPNLPKYVNSGTASSYNNKYEHIGYFFYNGYVVSDLDGNRNVFLRTRGYAHFTGYASSVYVPFDFN